LEQYKGESETAVAAKLRYLLHLAVGRQITADAPDGAFLSGGVDSAILVALQSQMQSEKAKTFSVALAGDEADLRAARVVADRWKTNHAELRLTPDEFFRAMDELMEIRRVPLSLPNEVLIYALSRVASKSVKAVLSGEGADELFGGYSNLLERLSRYETAHLEESNGNPLPLAALKAEMVAADFSNEANFLSSCYSWFTAPELKNLLRPSWLAGINNECNFVTDIDKWKAIDPGNRFHLWLEYTHLPHLLSRLDGATMAASIEGRVPFTDTAVVDYVGSLPPHMKYHPVLQSKKLLRETFSDLLPSQIIGRTKKPFHASLPVLFESPEGKRRMAAIVANPKLCDVFCTAELERLLNEDASHQNYLKTWLIFSLSSWLERNM
jgi:asparagine synthase (glutamine-hydrolysing)